MPYDATETRIGHGKRLAVSDTAEGTYNPVFGTISINLPERELGASEATNDDTPDNHKTYLPGLIDPGTVDFSYTYTETTFGQLETMYQARAVKFWKITLPDGAVCAFPGFLTANGQPMEQDETIVSEASIQVTGKMTYTAPPAP